MEYWSNSFYSSKWRTTFPRKFRSWDY